MRKKFILLPILLIITAFQTLAVFIFVISIISERTFGIRMRGDVIEFSNFQGSGLYINIWMFAFLVSSCIIFLISLTILIIELMKRRKMKKEQERKITQSYTA